MSILMRDGWWFLLLAIAGEVLVPFILGRFYKGYSHTTMVISALGSPGSPVRRAFNLWMLAAGILFLLSLPCLHAALRGTSVVLGSLVIICLAIFAIGACIFSAFFSVNESKDVVTAASRIHGAGSAIGFMLLLFVPLFLAIVQFRQGNAGLGAVSTVSFALSLAFFVLFIMGDKEAFRHTAIAKEGLWQRLNLLFMYLPLLCLAIQHLMKT